MKTPTAKQLPSGAWRCRLKLDGEQISITKQTKAEAEAEALRKKAAYMDGQKEIAGGNPRLSVAVKEYIDSRTSVISPSTLRAYKAYSENYFQPEMTKPIKSVNWQRAINREAQAHAPKTVKNAWALMSSAMAEYCFNPSVTLPAQKKPETAFLTAEQIPAFIEAVSGSRFEIPALLALSSLRRSEIYGLTWQDITDDGILVRAALVVGDDGLIRKTTKTVQSTRTVPYLIPRLRALLDESDRKMPVAYGHPNSLYKAVNTICAGAGLPLVGVHGLRRSFASLCYHLGLPERTTMALGGWDDYQTVHRHYIKLAEQDRLDGLRKLTSFFDKSATESATQI